MAGRCPAITSATTAAPRLWRTTWITTSSFWNTQFQPFWPSMRTPSEAVLPTVRADDAGAAETGQNGAGLGIEAGLAAPECGVERALADRQAEQLEQQPAEAAVADVMDEAQVHRQRDDVATERRPGLQPLGQRSQRGPAAAATLPGVALHPRHHRGDHRQVHLVEAACQRLVGLVQGRLAVRAPGWASGDSLVRCLGQPGATALAAEAALTGTRPGRLVVAVRLPALRWRQAGVVGRF